MNQDDQSSPRGVTLAAVQEAAQRIASVVVHTPTVFSPTLSVHAETELWLKCENLQHGAAFKARGACNAVLSLTEEQAAAGVVTHSSGNHAAALARAAGLRRIAAHIVMPENSSPVKLEAVRALGIKPILCGPTTADRESTAARIQRHTGAVLVHPFDDSQVIAGQGTVALELLQQFPDVDTIVVPVGGGGLLAGTLITVKALRPDVRVIAAEPAWADDASRSLQAGSIQPPERYDSIADGLRTSLGQLTFPIIREMLDEILLVDEEAIRSTTRLCLTEGRLVSEPSGAVSIACILQHRRYFAGRRVAAVISGGNLKLDTLASL